MDEKYHIYKKLIKHRNFLAFYIAMPSAIILILCNLFTLPVWIAGIFCIICAYIMMFWFLAKNICPWCGEPFFNIGMTFGVSPTGFSFLTQTKCQNCQQPNKVKKCNKLI